MLLLASPPGRSADKGLLLTDYHYTNQSDTTTVPGVDDARDFQELSDAMEYVHLLTCVL